MCKHTPGPWVATDNSWDFSTVYGPDGEAVALCKISDDVTEKTQDKFESIKDANARLIAAAPELLEALLEYKRLYEDVRPAGGWQGVYEIGNEAIAKATGDQS